VSEHSFIRNAERGQLSALLVLLSQKYPAK